MVSPRTPTIILRNGPSEGVQGAQAASIDYGEVYRNVSNVAGSVFDFASKFAAGVVAGYQAGAAKVADVRAGGGEAKGKEKEKENEGEKQKQHYREPDVFRDHKSMDNEFHDAHDKEEHERLVQSALAAFRRAEARGETNADISEAEYVAWKRQVAYEARKRREEEERLQRQKGLEEHRRREAGQRKITVPIPSSFGAPGIFVPGQGFTAVGERPAPQPAPSSSPLLAPSRTPEIQYSEPTFAKSVPDVSLLDPMDSGRSSSSYLSGRSPVTSRRPMQSAVSLNDLDPRLRSPSGSGGAERRAVWEKDT